MSVALFIIGYIFVGSNVAYYNKHDDELEALLYTLFWPLGLLLYIVIYLYYIFTVPMRFIFRYKENKEQTLKFWKWKKVGYDKEKNEIVRLK